MGGTLGWLVFLCGQNFESSVKILIDNPEPFLLAHGGFQIQIEQTRQALIECGLEVDFLRWWDPAQKGDVIHYFGRPFPAYVRAAHRKGLKVVFSPFHGETGARSPWRLRLQMAAKRLGESVVPSELRVRLAWDTYRLADACVVLTSWEAHLVRYLFRTPSEKVHVVPNGVEKVFSPAPDVKRGQWLVTTAIVRPMKRPLETARAAIEAQTPYWWIGKPDAASDSYYQRLTALCRANPQWLRYEGSVENRAQLAAIYQQARGFVLLSQWESLSLSAMEAAACGCPLLLSDLPWARSAFGTAARYCPLAGLRTTARFLRDFYDQAPALPPPPQPKDWTTVGQMLKGIYESVCGLS
jgi:glycosyltransferase involved in cell wall biosynthesis